MNFLGGGWTVIQRRGDFGRPEDFFLRGWRDYKVTSILLINCSLCDITCFKNGFGEPDEDLWLGLDAIHDLTFNRRDDQVIQLQIAMTDFDDNRTAIMINNFTVGPEREHYKISYKNYNSRLGSSLPARGTPFSTVDNDHDAWSGNCAERFDGAWWYSACHNSNLNGLYLKGPHESYGNGVNWYHWRGYRYSLKTTEMKLRVKPPRRGPPPTRSTTMRPPSDEQDDAS